MAASETFFLYTYIHVIGNKIVGPLFLNMGRLALMDILPKKIKIPFLCPPCELFNHI